MGANRIIFLAEGFYAAPGVERIEKPFSVQAIAAEATLETFHERILPRAAWLYVQARDLRFPQPSSDRLSDELRSVVAANAFRRSILANRLLQQLHDILSLERARGLQLDAKAAVLVDDV